jgi:hypothetical protein
MKIEVGRVVVAKAVAWRAPAVPQRTAVPLWTSQRPGKLNTKGIHTESATARSRTGVVELLWKICIGTINH